jgi:P4 family phage/plasmid primase-like protien
MNATGASAPLHWATNYIVRGWAPIPVPFRAKGPTLEGWQNLRIEEETAPQYFNGEAQNIGVMLGRVSGGLADVDLDCPEAVALAVDYLPPTTAKFGRSSKRWSHWLYNTDLCDSEDCAAIQFRDPLKDANGKQATLVELRIGAGGKGAQTVFPGSTHETGEQILWEPGADDDPAAVAGAELKVRVQMLAAAALVARHWPGDGSRHEFALTIGGVLARAGWAAEDIRSRVEHIAKVVGDEEWQERGKTAAGAVERLKAGNTTRGMPSLANALGDDVAHRIAECLGLRQDAAEERGAASAPASSEAGLAMSFAAANADWLRYAWSWKSWMVYDGQRWREDVLRQAERAVVAHACAAAAQFNTATLANGKTIREIERLARSDPRLAIGADVWDADPWLLNTPGGVIDLKTGETRPHDPSLYLTKMTSVAPEKKVSPHWLAFLEKTTGGEKTYTRYLQKLCGYALTGDISEQKVFFPFGEGQNGKSVLWNTVADIMADYARTAAIETFASSRSDRHPTELAYLRGARLVIAMETEPGRRWREGVIKRLTGGDKVAARFMHKDFFEYRPQFTLVIFGNHKPKFSSVDKSIRRRFRLLPFTMVIADEEVNKHLPEQLVCEWGGILQWMIEGCVAWREEGLGEPQVVKGSSDAYFEDEDVVGDWLAERCEVDPAGRQTVKDLFADWKAWAIDANEEVGSKRAFGDALEKHGYKRDRTNKARWIVGLRLRSFFQR